MTWKSLKSLSTQFSSSNEFSHSPGQLLSMRYIINWQVTSSCAACAHCRYRLPPTNSTLWWCHSSLAFSKPFRRPSIMEIFFTLSKRFIPPSLTFGYLHPPAKNFFDVLTLFVPHSGSGLAREWLDTPVNPFAEKTIPEGTVMRPILKQIWEMTTEASYSLFICKKDTKWQSRSFLLTQEPTADEGGNTLICPASLARTFTVSVSSEAPHSKITLPNTPWSHNPHHSIWRPLPAMWQGLWLNW